MRLTRFLLALAVCVASVTVLAHASAAPATSRHVAVYGSATLSHVANHDIPWKAATHKAGLRRSSEQVKPLLLSPGARVSGLIEIGNAAPDAQRSFYQHLRQLPRAPRGPPAPPSALLS